MTQIDVLEQHQILLVLTDKTMYSYPLEALDPEENAGSMSKRGRKICHANFFKAGVCVGQHLVCCVKTSALSTTIKVYEPMGDMAKKSRKTGFSRMLAGGQDVLKPYKVRFPRHPISFVADVARNSTFPRNRLRSTSCAPSSALAAPRVSRSYPSRLSRRSPSWTRPTLHSTLSQDAKTSSRFTSNAFSPSSCSATRTFRSLSTATAGGRGRTGRLRGRARHRPLPYSTPTSLRSSPASSK